MDRRQNLSYAHAVCRGTAKEEIEAFKAIVIINIHHLRRIQGLSQQYCGKLMRMISTP